MREAGACIKQWLWAGVLAAGLLVGLPAHGEIEIVDQAGRSVRLNEPARRIFFSEPGDFAMLALLVENPASRIVAWNRWRLDERTLGSWRSIDSAAFEQIAQLVSDGPQNLNAGYVIRLHCVVESFSPGRAHPGELAQYRLRCLLPDRAIGDRRPA